MSRSQIKNGNIAKCVGAGIQRFAQMIDNRGLFFFPKSCSNEFHVPLLGYHPNVCFFIRCKNGNQRLASMEIFLQYSCGCWLRTGKISVLRETLEDLI